LHLNRNMPRKYRLSALVGTALTAIAVTFWLRDPPTSTSGGLMNAEAAAAHDETTRRTAPVRPLDERVVSAEERADAIARARVWHEPSVPIPEANLLGGGTPALAELSCKFKISELSGTTPKFDCELDSGEVIRVKYGKGPEIPAEAAATRLLNALGFGADEITLVGKLRCYGCPEEPFSTMKAVELTRAQPLYRHVVNYESYEDFDWVAIERKFEARPIETTTLEGWAFFELETIDPEKGGAPRSHVDAIRLLAIFLAHWDNKAENQRLVCRSREWPENTRCRQPFLLLQDLGATFGPSKVDLEAWQQVRIWDDRATCRISMRDLPFNGATFGDARVTESGRLFLARLLTQLSERQLTDLFSGARFDQKRGLFSAIHPVQDWVRAFKAKVAAISEGAPCPSV